VWLTPETRRVNLQNNKQTALCCISLDNYKYMYTTITAQNMQNIKLAYPVCLQIVLCLKEHESEWGKDSSVLKLTFHGTHQVMGTFK